MTNKPDLTDLGILLDKMLENPDEWVIHYTGWGKHRKHILRHPRGDLALDVTYKYCFDISGRAVLSLADREYLWEKVKPIVQKQTGIQQLDFDNRCQEATRKYNRKKFFKETMASIMGVDNGKAD